MPSSSIFVPESRLTEAQVKGGFGAIGEAVTKVEGKIVNGGGGLYQGTADLLTPFGGPPLSPFMEGLKPLVSDAQAGAGTGGGVVSSIKSGTQGAIPGVGNAVKVLGGQALGDIKGAGSNALGAARSLGGGAAATAEGIAGDTGGEAEVAAGAGVGTAAVAATASAGGLSGVTAAIAGSQVLDAVPVVGEVTLAVGAVAAAAYLGNKYKHQIGHAAVTAGKDTAKAAVFVGREAQKGAVATGHFFATGGEKLAHAFTGAASRVIPASIKNEVKDTLHGAQHLASGAEHKVAGAARSALRSFGI